MRTHSVQHSWIRALCVVAQAGTGTNKCGLCGESTKGHTCRMKAGNALSIPMAQRSADRALAAHTPKNAVSWGSGYNPNASSSPSSPLEASPLGLPGGERSPHP